MSSRAPLHTQFFLKQSCEQKKLPLISSFRHVGHCKDPASLGQSAPKHFFLAGGSSMVAKRGWEVRKGDSTVIGRHGSDSTAAVVV